LGWPTEDFDVDFPNPTTIGGTAVTGPSDLGPAIWSHRAGAQVEVTWRDRSGARHSATVRLVAGPAA